MSACRFTRPPEFILTSARGRSALFADSGEKAWRTAVLQKPSYAALRRADQTRHNCHPLFSLLFVLLLLTNPLAMAHSAIASQAANTPGGAPQAQEQDVLPPAVREKAIRYSHTQYAIYFGNVALELVIYAVLWLSGFGAWLRDLAGRVSRRLFVQCLIFVPIFWGVACIATFPLDYYAGFTVEHRFDLSTQHFTSWIGDWGKRTGLTAVVVIIVAWILYRIIRRSPKRWWLWFWLITVPLVLIIMFGEPYIIEPLFYKFTPLAQTEPALTARIQQMLHQAGINISDSRIYEMNASAKTRAMNAYVSGIGHSKRVVVWDTTVEKLTPDETLAVLAHETGHYALHHGLKEFALDEFTALGWFLAGFFAVLWAIRRWGTRTKIESAGDLASLPLFILVLTVIIFLASPLYCGISRHYEHQADRYGLELTKGVIPHPNAAAVRSFKILGEVDLEDPDPNPLIKFWLFTHPPLKERIRFAESYHPWTEGKPMGLLKRQKGK